MRLRVSTIVVSTAVALSALPLPAVAAGPQPEPPTACKAARKQLDAAKRGGSYAARHRAFMRGSRVLARMPAGRSCPDPNVFLVDPGLSPSTRREGSPPVAEVIDEDGAKADFVARELVVLGRRGHALHRLLERYDGKVVRTDRLGAGLGSLRVVRIKPRLASLRPLTHGWPSGVTGSAVRVSSRAGLRTLAAAARRAPGGLKVGLNLMLRRDAFVDHSTSEGPPGPGITPAAYEPDAYRWSFLNAPYAASTGTHPNYGVTDAWTLLDRFGRLDARVPIAILDGGFSLRAGGSDLPTGARVIPARMAEVPNRTPCSGGGACPWHGTNVAGAAAGVPDNSVGAAGPGGPVVRPLLIATPANIVATVAAIERARVNGAGIVNISSGADVPAIATGALAPFDRATAAYRRSGMLLFASAGNENLDVDAEDALWEEAWTTPCENHGVICVGGVGRDSVVRHPASNYGCRDVDLYAPFDVYVGPDPQTAADGVTPATAAQAVSGTSFSAPYVAGVAALMLAADPGLSADEVERLLRRTAFDGFRACAPRVVQPRAAIEAAMPALAKISSPREGAAIDRGTTASFAVEVNEAGRGTPVSVVWRLEDGSEIGRGRHLSRIDLPTGRHRATVTVRFADGSDLSDSVTFTVGDEAPRMTIASPRPDEEVLESRPELLLQGGSFDAGSVETGFRLPEDRVAWLIDGVEVSRGYVARVPTSTLARGTHVIVLRGSDGALTGEARVTVRVVPNPTGIPSITIVQPAALEPIHATHSDSTGRWYADVTLRADASDPEDGTPLGEDRFTWWRETVGVPGSERLATGSRPVVRLYAGLGCDGVRYRLTAVAGDSDGNVAHDEVVVQVLVAPC